ncbi:MAG: class I SAM-dependent methyltransferase [Deltaproteobacteria bacterium]|nr:class I SAM-dependent methyltransferase [Deltaproteobacteria bacterium]
MKLNRVEKLMMNNPIRSRLQRLEADQLRKMGGCVEGGHVLEVGCGRGAGTQLILATFGATSVDAFDFDPDMVRRARKRLAPHGDRVRVWQGDITSIEADDDSYDAVFDFAIIHHVPRWRDALVEVLRVLKPGGRFFSEEVLRDFIHHPLWSRVLDHPMEDRFDHDEFRDALASGGFEVVATQPVRRDMAFFVADKPTA